MLSYIVDWTSMQRKVIYNQNRKIIYNVVYEIRKQRHIRKIVTGMGSSGVWYKNMSDGLNTLPSTGILALAESMVQGHCIRGTWLIFSTLIVASSHFCLTWLPLFLLCPHYDPVSYTHLDVYKRQYKKCNM